MKQAYEKLARERPIIIQVLHRDRDRHQSARQLAEKTCNRGDSEELRRAILKAARFVFGDALETTVSGPS